MLEELLQLPDWSSKLSRALSELPHKMQNREKHITVALTVLTNCIASILRYQHTGTLLCGKVTLVRPTGESEHSCGLNEVKFSPFVCSLTKYPMILKYREMLKFSFAVYDIVLYCWFHKSVFFTHFHCSKIARSKRYLFCKIFYSLFNLHTPTNALIYNIKEV